MNKTGFVIVGGVKILITVRDGQTSRWVSARPSSPPLRGSAQDDGDGPHLISIERALKKVRGVREKLLDGKMQAI